MWIRNGSAFAITGRLLSFRVCYPFAFLGYSHSLGRHSDIPRLVAFFYSYDVMLDNPKPVIFNYYSISSFFSFCRIIPSLFLYFAMPTGVQRFLLLAQGRFGRFSRSMRCHVCSIWFLRNWDLLWVAFRAIYDWVVSESFICIFPSSNFSVLSNSSWHSLFFQGSRSMVQHSSATHPIPERFCYPIDPGHRLASNSTNTAEVEEGPALMYIQRSRFLKPGYHHVNMPTNNARSKSL